uniref:Cadherin domain-containing protein n=1 Tax=Mastacembelus armatus TaxID=205130 RepID=A0A7N8XKZ8_9TELE
MQDHYIVKVNANDSAWSISTDVTIVITDVNDNIPVFTDNFYTTVLPETKAKEVFVIQVFATDADIGRNREILYVIEPSNEEFWVNVSSGEIYTKQVLTLHNYPFKIYTFTVIAFDCGSVPLYSNTSVTVKLEPYNYYPPMFLPFHANIEYALSGGNASDFFWIQAENGKVTLNQTLVESINLYLSLIVVAKDQSSRSLSSQIEITFEVTGRNQFSPSFREPNVSFSIPEDLLVGSVIGKIQAEDRDYGPNGAITYSITSKNQYLPFLVGEASGLLTLITELDFEKEGIYHLQISATDGGWVSKTTKLNVTVIVMDVNDNPPAFSSSEYVTSVPENSEIGTNVLDVKAVDADSVSGIILVNSPLDRELWPVYNLTVIAIDNGSPPATGTTNVIVSIGDVNDNAPKLTLTEAQVKENQPEGTIVARLDAYDSDLPSNQRPFIYWLVNSSSESVFSLTPDGVLVTTRPTDREQMSAYRILVAVRDAGIPPLSSTTIGFSCHCPFGKIN